MDGGSLPDAQHPRVPGLVDLRDGQPDPALLPVALLAETAATSITASPATTLAYGANRGPGSMIAALCDRLAVVDGSPPDPTEVLITAGASHAIGLAIGQLASRGDTVLVEDPTYDLAVALFRSRGLAVEPVPMDGDGLVIDALVDRTRRLRARRRQVAFIYAIPTWHNPTGITMPLERRREFLETVKTLELPVLEDDTYRELAFSGTSPPSLWSDDHDGLVTRVGTISKVLGPGLRVGWLTGSRGMIDLLADDGVLRSGGGIAHFAATVVGRVIAGPGYDPHVQAMRGVLRHRSEALLRGLRTSDLVHADAPAGGYFAWCRAHGPRELVAALRDNGVAVRDGAQFVMTSATPVNGEIPFRIAFCGHDDAVLESAGRTIAAVVERATTTARRA
jgi:2-aminoadipate transaminase